MVLSELRPESGSSLASEAATSNSGTQHLQQRLVKSFWPEPPFGNAMLIEEDVTQSPDAKLLSREPCADTLQLHHLIRANPVSSGHKPNLKQSDDTTPARPDEVSGDPPQTSPNAWQQPQLSMLVGAEKTSQPQTRRRRSIPSG